MASQKKKLGDTRREREAKVVKTFGPLYALVEQLRSDAVDSIRGEPVLLAWGDYMHVDATLLGFAGCFRRIAKDVDVGVLERVRRSWRRVRRSCWKRSKRWLPASRHARRSTG